MNFLTSFLSEFQWYRKKMGGIWYKVKDERDTGGVAGALPFWTRDPEDLLIIKKEEW